MITGSSVLIKSCTPQACFEETNSFVKASLYDNVTKKQKAADSLTVYGLSRDSVKIYDGPKAYSQYSFRWTVQPAVVPSS
jgi:hypothetical protein